VVGFIFMAMTAYNVNESVCFIVPNDPPHCIGYENGDTPKGFSSIPCGRGDGGENPILYPVTPIVGFGSVLIVTPTVIVVTMLLMYRSVSKIEQRMQNYGVKSLRLNAQSVRVVRNRGENTTETNSTRRSAHDQGMMSRLNRFFMCMIPSCLRNRDDQPPISARSNRATSQKRAILHMAAGYAFAWALVKFPFIIYFFLNQSCYAAAIFACLPDSPSRSLQLFGVHAPQSEKRETSTKERGELDLASSFYQGIHVERRKEENGRKFNLKKYSYW
jgi:hypothetical protein